MNFIVVGNSDKPRCFATDEPYFDVEPLGHASLVALLSGADKHLPLVLRGVYETSAEGRRLPDSAVCNITVPMAFRGAVEFFGLVPGGWIPPLIGGGRVALLDRNMVHRLKTLKPRTDEVGPESPEWLYRLFAKGTFEVSIATHLLEGNRRREPTLNEMASEMEAATAELTAVLPHAKVHVLRGRELEALHALLTERSSLTEKSRAFLLRVAPLIAFASKPSAQKGLENRIIETAEELGLRKTALCVVASLSCLYEDPRLPSGDVYRPGRAVLKPKPVYCAEQVHNATADLNALELLVNTFTMLNNYGGILFSEDVGLAAFWAGLEIRDPVATSTGTTTARSTVTVTLSEALFPTLSEEARRELAARLVN